MTMITALTSSPPATAPLPAPSGVVLTASLEPAKGTPGGVYKVVEKDTGRVIIELPVPFEEPASAAPSDNAARVDLSV